MGHQHHHPKLSDTATHVGVVRGGERRRLMLVLVVTGVTMVGELVAGYLFDSVALLGDAFHMMTHFGAVATSWAAIWIASRPAAAEKTYRNWRMEVLASLFNGVVLIPMAAYVLWEAYDRWQRPRAIFAEGVLAVGGIGLLSNVVSAAFLHHHSKQDLNLRGAFLHMVADSVSSVGVIAAGLVVLLTGWTLADPLTAALISVMIVVWSFGLIRDACRILLEWTPSHLELATILSALKEEPEVTDVHDLHVWTITSKMHALTAHVVLREDVPVSKTEQIGYRLQHILDSRFDINHATLQFETSNGAGLHCKHGH